MLDSQQLTVNNRARHLVGLATDVIEATGRGISHIAVQLHQASTSVAVNSAGGAGEGACERIRNTPVPPRWSTRAAQLGLTSIHGCCPTKGAMRAASVLVVASFIGCGADDTELEYVEGVFVGDCGDGVDNDGDGFLDCDDQDCLDKDDCAGLTTGTGTGTPTGTGTGSQTGTGTGAVPWTGSTVVDDFIPPGCIDAVTWRYSVDTLGWASTSYINAFETGQPYVAFRWNEENTLHSVGAEPYNQADHLGIDLIAGADYSTFIPGVSTRYRCGYHDNPAIAASTYVVRLRDADNNFSDCAFGLDALAPADAMSSVKQGTAWDTNVHNPPSGDWWTEFNSDCSVWNFR